MWHPRAKLTHQGLLNGVWTVVTSFALSILTLAQSVPESSEIGTSSYPFDLNQVSLSSSRWKNNQDRTLNYIKSVDVERLLYNFRANHGLSTNDALPNGGWDAPNFPFRTHFQGHFLTAWSYCHAVLRDQECTDRATYFVAELGKCQGNNDDIGFSKGYLSGFPESEFTAVEDRTLNNGNVPYYAIHKTLAGLLDVWRHMGDEKARDILLDLAAWVELRTDNLSYDQMQAMLSTEFGGMNEVMADIYHQTGDSRWVIVAQRFDHAAVFDPLASNQDQLSGLHANTQVPKWIGAAREYKATGTLRYKDIALHAWSMTVHQHSYAVGGNSQAEHFRPANEIAGYLTEDTCEACNTYNMLKLTRELWTTQQDPDFFDFYETALLNHLLGQQDPTSNHGHVTYFTPLNPGGRRGVGPAWGGGTWSTDYDSFWCCQGTALETNTKLMDSIYWRDESDTTLFVNLFIPSTLDWLERGLIVSQDTDFPYADTTTLRVEGGAGDEWTLKVRVPGWIDDGQRGEIVVKGESETAIYGDPGTFIAITRSWSDGDIVTVRLPMSLRLVPANDDASVSAIAYGPVVLCGNYGEKTVGSTPILDLGSVVRGSRLDFTAQMGAETVELGPFFEAQGFNYNVYWEISGAFPTGGGEGDGGGGEDDGGDTGGGQHCSGMWGQCGGIGWTGATCCVDGASCTTQNDWYYQCL